MTENLNIESFADRVFKISSTQEFNELAIELFRHQCNENKVYANYLGNLSINAEHIRNIDQVPCLPIDFFKSHRIVSGDFKEEKIFFSSGTSGMQASRHYIAKLDVYKQSFMRAFRSFYGAAESFTFLGLLPSYMEREGSSLIFMVKTLMEAGGTSHKGFFLDEHRQLAEVLQSLSAAGLPSILIGVSFALLDFAEKYQFPLGEHCILMETGGMKGRREEITREELHQRLCKSFQISAVHSEYGMTELLSQAYSKEKGRFYPPPWMKVLIRDIQDPFSYLPAGRSGAINIIDLANIHSCAFIETQDIGRLFPDGSFEVLGRTDASDIRGCSLLLS